MLTFANPEYFAFLVIAAIVFCIAQLYYVINHTRALRLLLTARSTFLLIGYRPMKKWLKIVASSLGFIFLAIALLRPQIEKDPIKIKQEGWNVLVALDISRSMRSSDVEPSRLSAAKEKIKQLVAALSCTRLGLVLFSQDAFIQCPLTDDKDAFLLFLDPVDSETLSGSSTALDRALTTSLDALKNIPDDNKIVVLLTDGEDFSHNLSSIAKQFKDHHILLCGFGIGTPEGAPIPMLDTHGNVVGYEKGDDSHVVISRLNEPVLRDLTKELDGFYVRMTSDDTDVQRVKKFVAMQKKGRFEDKEVSVNFDLYPFFLLGGLLCLLFE